MSSPQQAPHIGTPGAGHEWLGPDGNVQRAGGPGLDQPAHPHLAGRGHVHQAVVVGHVGGQVNRRRRRQLRAARARRSAAASAALRVAASAAIPARPPSRELRCMLAPAASSPATASKPPPAMPTEMTDSTRLPTWRVPAHDERGFGLRRIGHLRRHRRQWLTRRRRTARRRCEHAAQFARRRPRRYGRDAATRSAADAAADRRARAARSWRRRRRFTRPPTWPTTTAW